MAERNKQSANNIIPNLGSAPNTHWGLAVELTSLPTYATLKSDGKLSSPENILKGPVPDPLKLKIHYYVIENKLQGFSLMLFLKKPKPWPCKFIQIKMKSKGR